jgi:tetratricopeptide (TPR) repeat protein
VRPLALVCAFCMACGALLASRLAYAELISRGFLTGDATVPALIRAAALDRFAAPAAYFGRLAELDPDRAAPWLDAALESNPRLTPAWIAKGLAAEQAQAYAAAEHDLLQAASVDHRYLPAWTLTNFYFRQNRRPEFWIWARRAATLTYDDFRPLLALAHALEPNPRAVIENLGGPASLWGAAWGPAWQPALLHADLDYLVQQDRLDAAQQIARLLLARQSSADVPRLIALADRQIRAGHARDALELWNAVSSAAPLDSGGVALANGNLAASPSGVAFDWRLPSANGFYSVWQPQRLTFILSGAQPESFALLEQIVPLDPARRYRMCFEFLTVGLASPTGLTWDLDGESAPPFPPATTWHAGEAVWIARSGATCLRLGKLRLLYRRGFGTVRAPGQLELRHLKLEAL